MTDRPPPSLPPDVLRVVRLASVAPHVRAMFARLPAPLALDAELPADPSALSATARQLLKLALLGTTLTLRSAIAAPDGATPALRVSLGDRRCALGPFELARDLRTVTNTILETLFEGADFTRVLENFAFQSSTLGTLQRITNHMLQSTDVDAALYVMLSGITSGYGLGFNRAALFIHAPTRDVFAGSKAIGPADETEAHRIWEEIEFEDKTIDQLIGDYAHHHFDTQFQLAVQRIDLVRTDAAGDELAELDGDDGAPRLLTRDTVVNPGLARLSPAREFVLAAVHAHGRRMGIVFADNLYSGAPIAPEQLNYFGFFIDQTALVWENLSLLKRVETLARYDALTGVFNRREFEARFALEASRVSRGDGRCGVLLIDADFFKQVNDTRGHEAGDAVLRALGELLRSELRTHDTAARYGGDEFAVLLPDAGAEQMRSIARRIGVAARAAGVSLSIGGVCYPDDTKDTATMISAADALLYRAKNAGRGCAMVSGGERVSFE